MAASDAEGPDVLDTAGHSGPIGLAMIEAAAEHASPFSSELRVPSRVTCLIVQRHLAGSHSTMPQSADMAASDVQADWVQCTLNILSQWLAGHT